MSIKKRKPTKIMPYRSAPSGKVRLYNYKEPFIHYSGGFGYYGVLLFDLASDRVQCHRCGKWFESLGAHVIKTHRMSVSEYKTDVGLRNTTALIGERFRAKLIANGQERFKNLKVHTGKMAEKTKEKIRKAISDNRMESQNSTGCCPIQILNDLRELAEDLGRTPTYADIEGSERVQSVDTIAKVYGNVGNALEMAGLSKRKPGHNVKHSGTGKKLKYTDDMLLDFIRNFERHEGRVPSASDSRRSLIPHRSVYRKRFGSWKAAVRIALGDGDSR
jgi:hypothetical protein